MTKLALVIVCTTVARTSGSMTPTFTAKPMFAKRSNIALQADTLERPHALQVLRNAIVPALSYGSVAATAVGSAAVALSIAGPAAAWVVAGSVAIPTIIVLGEFVLLGDGKFVGRLMGGRPADERLVSMVNDVAARAQHDPPAHVFEIPTNEMNAFAAGFSKRGTCVAVTRGLRQELTDRELKAVIAHELGHLSGGDTMKNMHMAAAAAGLGGLFSAGRTILRSDSRSRNKKDKDKDSSGSLVPLGLGLMGAGLVSQFTAHLLRLGASRHHEYAADKVASDIFGADTMVSALNKIHASAARGIKRDVLGARGGAFSHMYIAPDPSVFRAGAKADASNAIPQVSWARKALNLLSTHPTLDERVHAIRAGDAAGA